MANGFNLDDSARLKELETQKALIAKQSADVDAAIAELQKNREEQGRQVTVEIPLRVLVTVQFPERGEGTVTRVRCFPPRTQPGYVSPRWNFNSGNELLVHEAMRVVAKQRWTEEPVEWVL